MRRGIVSLAALLLPSMASAHLGTVPPDLDVYLARGEAVVVARPAGPPRPCGAKAFPALLRLDVVQVLDGGVASGPVDVLVPGGSAAHLPDATPRIVVLRAPLPVDEHGCARIPDLVIAGPFGIAPDPAADPAGWRRYVTAVRSLPSGGEERSRARLDLWAAALASPDEVLAGHAARQLAIAAHGKLPTPVMGAVEAVATSADHSARVRVPALEIAAKAMAPAAIARLAGDPSLTVARTAMWELLRRAAHTDVSAARPVVAGLLSGALPPGTRPDSPAADIRRAGLAAVLGAMHDAQGRELLSGDLDSPLFDVRRFAIAGLGSLAMVGDEDARTALTGHHETDPRLEKRLAAVVAALPRIGEPHHPPVSLSPKMGLRMLLVLAGLLALLGMLLLPVMQRRRHR